MGVRLYNPVSGRFLSVDPVPGGNANAYTYPLDPVNLFDYDGRSSSSGSSVMNDAEKKLCKSIGVKKCATFVKISHQVRGKVNRVMAKANSWERNAVRHFAWQAALVFFLGYRLAVLFGNAHEGNSKRAIQLAA